MRDRWRAWRSVETKTGSDEAPDGGAGHLELARESLTELIDDARLPAGVREALASDYLAVAGMLEKLEHGHLHIAVFGRVSTGKSSLLNALIGEQRFAVSPLHGETRQADMQVWQEQDVGGVFLIDTPGLDEAGGESREAMATEVANRADLVLYVLDGDITDTEREALETVVGQGRPVILVLNKSDLYTTAEREALLASVREKAEGLVHRDNVLAAAAEPRPQLIVRVADDGSEETVERLREADVAELRLRLWDVIEAEGKTLAALNASLFAADLSDQVGTRILEARKSLGERLVRTYCIGKGVAVAFNPLPVADLLAAAFIDVGMVVHLSRVYDLPLSRREAGSLIAVIAGEATALMGTVWALNLISSALKVGTLGLSTILTGGAQGAIAWYSTYVVGGVASRYLAQGKSWGSGGPKQVVNEILESLDQESVLKEARREIRQRLGARA